VPRTATIEQLQQQLASSAPVNPAATHEHIITLGEPYRAAVNEAAIAGDYATRGRSD
jgi:hypothetical protein